MQKRKNGTERKEKMSARMLVSVLVSVHFIPGHTKEIIL